MSIQSNFPSEEEEPAATFPHKGAAPWSIQDGSHFPSSVWDNKFCVVSVSTKQEVNQRNYMNEQETGRTGN